MSRLPLAYPRLWLAGGLLVAVMILVLTVIPMGPAFSVGGDKAAHVAAFAVLMIWFCGIYRLRVTPWVAVWLLAFAIAIELVQSQLPYRMAELGDVFADILGIGIGWALSALGLSGWTRWLESLLPLPRGV